ncbi:DUF1493 family protein [Chania multitudinisentens]|uniref:DUF1493 family protein n=1 Tax=Chania multitudinisentens TaxID=1639108 RepID=UPI0003E1286B|nr:DUF1493 family protein [Chania multitudinisentens]
MMSIEKEIIDYIFEQHSPRKYYLFGSRPTITLDTELTEAGIDILWEDAEDTLDYYFKHWKVKLEGFDITRYFDPAFLGSPEPDPPLKPLYVWMLVESAKAGRWLYD